MPTETENVKRQLTRALEVISLVKGLVRRCQFKRKSTEGGSHCVTDCRQVMTVLQPFVMNRFGNIQLHCWPFTLENDAHAQNRERVPLTKLAK